MTTGVRRAAAALFVLALLALSSRASARELRPYDAPRIDAEPISAPPRPSDYYTHEDAGITLLYQPSTSGRVSPLEARLPAIRAELSAALGRDVLAHVEIRVASAPGEMVHIAPVEQTPSYATAVAFSKANPPLVVLSATSPISSDPPDLEVVLRHALAHLALDEALGGKPVPRWFHEGYAVHFSGEDAALRAEQLSVASLRRELLELRQLEEHFPAEPPQRSVAYVEAADFLRFLAAPSSSGRFAEMLAKLRGAEPCSKAGACSPTFEGAIGGAYGESFASVELRWRKDVARRYGFVPAFAAATLVWALIAAAMMLRRIRRRRALAARPPSRGASPSRRAGLASYMGRRERGDEGVPLGRPSAAAYAGAPVLSTEGSARRARAARVLAVDTLLDDAAPSDREVPKVEHDGRWYTLH